MQTVRSETLRDFLEIKIGEASVKPVVTEERDCESYHRKLIRYLGSEDDEISAYLFLPKTKISAAVLVHHQHNGERHFGKSEVAGMVGDPLQAFGPALAARGVAVLAPDSIGFEDRRKNKKGTEPGEGDDDWLQHFNEMAYRLVQGKTLMAKVLEDAGIALSVLSDIAKHGNVGVFGHSYGGNTALFQAATDPRVKFVCVSGALGSYKNKMAKGTGLEMALAVPGIYPAFDLDQVLAAVAAPEILVVSADGDEYSDDAKAVVTMATMHFERQGSRKNLQHQRYGDGHPLTRERFDFIVDWLARN